MNLFYVWLGLTIAAWITAIVFVSLWFRKKPRDEPRETKRNE